MFSSASGFHVLLISFCSCTHGMWIRIISYFTIAIHLSVRTSCPERSLAARNARVSAAGGGRQGITAVTGAAFRLENHFIQFFFPFKDLHFKNAKVEPKNYKSSVFF